MCRRIVEGIAIDSGTRHILSEARSNCGCFIDPVLVLLDKTFALQNWFVDVDLIALKASLNGSRP